MFLALKLWMAQNMKKQIVLHPKININNSFLFFLTSYNGSFSDSAELLLQA